MNTIQFLAEWALRSSILILSGALLLWALRVKDPSVRLAAWTAMLCGSLAIPVLTALAPSVPLRVMRQAPQTVAAPVMLQAPQTVAAPVMVRSDAPAPAEPHHETKVSKPFDGARAAVAVYVLVALTLLLRLCVGLAMSLRLLRGSRATGRAAEGIEIRESDRVATPVTLGVASPAIVLPVDWGRWDNAKLDAVLAHERSHIRRHDPAVQLLSAIHRALLWHSPLSWFLHRRIVRVAEEASDDAAVAATRDRALYAEVLLDFMRRAVPGPNWQAVPMARYGPADQRIHRILDGTVLSRGVTRWSVAAILALGSPIAYLVAAAQPQRTLQAQPAQPAPRQVSHVDFPAAAPAFIAGLGNVSAYTTVTIKPRVDGQLMSVSFKEGSMVQAGQVLASIDPQPYQIKLFQAEGQLDRDQAQLTEASQRARSGTGPDSIVAQLEGSVRGDQATIDSAKLQLTYTQITAPITGVAGLRLVDPGNIVHASDTTGIVVINQIQPISVLFTIQEDILPQVLARLREGATPPVEAWNRDNSAKIATGRLTAADNQIDQETGTAKLKAVFDNQNGALFPNEFVNVHLFVNAK
jgi:multidrug efflux pump subunit AcrA (membrane-fusion protein)